MPQPLGSRPPSPATRSIFFDSASAATVAGMPEIEGLDTTGSRPMCVLTIGCAVHVDVSLNVWSISTSERAVGSDAVRGGVPMQHFDDVTNEPTPEVGMPSQSH